MSVENFNDILDPRQKCRWKFPSTFCFQKQIIISKYHSNLQGFQSNIWGYKFTKKAQFLLKRLTLGKSIVFKGFFDNTM